MEGKKAGKEVRQDQKKKKKKLERGQWADSWDRADELPRLIFDSLTILFFGAAEKRDKATDAETQITSDAPCYHEDDTQCEKPNFCGERVKVRTESEEGRGVERERKRRIKGIVSEGGPQLPVSGLIYNSYFIIVPREDLFNFSCL